MKMAKKSLRNKISGKLIIGGACVCLASTVFILCQGIGKTSTEKRLELLQKLKTDNPSLVVDTKTYEDQIKRYNKLDHYGTAGLILGSLGTIGGLVNYRKN